jgi:hypothetical protein
VPVNPFVTFFGVVGVDNSSGIAVKLATSFIGPFIVKDMEELDPGTVPDQLANVRPKLGLAETETVLPLLYQVVPAGVTVPALDGLTEVARLYWVVK